MLISAWNENDEGHWVVPSLMNGTAKMEAVQAAINRTKARREAINVRVKELAHRLTPRGPSAPTLTWETKI